MAAQALTILKIIPWKEILTSVAGLVASIPRKPKTSTSDEIKISDLDKRISEFEKEHSELAEKIGIQLDTVTKALCVVSKRVNYFLVLSALAFIIGAVSFVLVLIK